MPGLLSKLTNFKQKLSEESHHHLHYGHSGTLTRSGLHHDHYGGGHSGTLTRYHKDDHHYYGPIKNLQESDRDLSTSSPVLLEMYDHVKVKTLVVWLTRAIVHFICFQVHPDPDGKKDKSNMKAAIARLASQENLTNSYDLVLGLVRRPPPPPQHSPRPCRHQAPSPPRHHHCSCHHHHHHCDSSRERTKERRPQSRSRPSSPSPARGRSRSRPSSPPPPPPQQQPTKSKWSFGKKAKRSASADRSRSVGGDRTVELGWDDVRGVDVLGQWEDTGNHGWSATGPYHTSRDNDSAANTAQLAGELCRRATALRRTLYKLPSLISNRNEFLEIIK